MSVFTGYALQYLSDLQAIAPSDRANLMCLAVQEKKAFYQFDDTNTGTADNNLVIAPNEGEGRWLALGAPSSGGSGDGGSGGGANIFRDDTTYPGDITPAFLGQIFVGTSNGSVNVAVAIGLTAGDWHYIYNFSNS